VQLLRAAQRLDPLDRDLARATYADAMRAAYLSGDTLETTTADADGHTLMDAGMRVMGPNPLTVISALPGKHSLNISLRISVKRSPSRTSLMKTVIVTISFSPLPPTALMVLSSSEKASLV